MAHDIGAGKTFGLVLMLLIGIVVILEGVLGGTNQQGTQQQLTKGDRNEHEPEPKPPPTQPLPGQQVSAEYFRWIKSQVQYDCQQKTKLHIDYNMRSDGMFYGKNEMDSINFLLRYNRWTKFVSSDNTIDIVGDSAEVQNNFGNWVRANYWCQVNLDTKAVIHASISSGRFQGITE